MKKRNPIWEREISFKCFVLMLIISGLLGLATGSILLLTTLLR